MNFFSSSIDVVARVFSPVASILHSGDGENHIAGIDQRRQKDDGPFGLQAKLLRDEVIDSIDRLNQFLAVQNLSLAFGLQQVENVLRVLGAGGFQFIPVKQFKRIQYGGGLFGAGCGLGNAAEGILCGLGDVLGA